VPERYLVARLEPIPSTSPPTQVSGRLENRPMAAAPNDVTTSSVSALESRLMLGASSKPMIHAYRSLIGTELRTEACVNNEYATGLAITRFAEGMGDGNPLWTDPAHASGSVYGGLIAPPSFIFCCLGSIQVGWRGLGGCHAETLLDFSRTIRLDDTGRYVWMTASRPGCTSTGSTDRRRAVSPTAASRITCGRSTATRTTRFGRSGPQAEGRALDLTIQAMNGVMSATGKRGGPPLKAGVPVADFLAGAHLYGWILSALVGRACTGRGRVVEVSMLEALFATLLPSAGHAYQTNSAPERSGNPRLGDDRLRDRRALAEAHEVADHAMTDWAITRVPRRMERPELDELLHVAW
jgi:CoA-transferase family III/N-terminal half of MaoC dehydratase